jgi:hypothetical protein
MMIQLPARFATTAAATATAISTPTAAAAKSTAATAAAKSTATATATFFARARFIHVDIAATERHAVQAFNGLGGFFGIGHFHESKSARLAGVPVAHDADAFDCAVGRESSF